MRVASVCTRPKSKLPASQAKVKLTKLAKAFRQKFTVPDTATSNRSVRGCSQLLCCSDLLIDSVLNLNSVPRSASKMHQSAGLHKESRVCVPVTGFNANAQCQAVHCNAAQCNAVLCTRKINFLH